MIISHASANANLWLRTVRHRTGDNQMSLTAINPITTGPARGRMAGSGTAARIAIPRADLDMRGAFKASTSASAATL